MPDQTKILSLPLIMPAQAQKHVTHNEAIRLLDVLVQLAVATRDLTAPPANPGVGERHIVAAGATGAWAGRGGQVALWGGTAWEFFAALPGWRAHVLDEGKTAVFDGAVWQVPAAGGGAGGPLSAPTVGINAAADAANRLSVAAPATLLTHEGAGHQLKVNCAGPADTASLLFQQGFSGRAEMGLMGAADFGVKVSDDGATFRPALTAEAATGRVTLHQPLLLEGQAADPAAPANGTVWTQAGTGQVRARVGGVTRILDQQQGLPFLVPPSGEHVMTTTGTGGATTITGTGFAGRADIFPFMPRADIAVDRAAVNVTTAVAGALAKVVVYGADANGRPSALILETGDLDLSGTGVKQVAAALTLRCGLTYWIGVRHSSTAVLSGWALTATPDINGGAPGAAVRKTLRRTVPYATPAPATWGYAAAEVNAAGAIAVWLRVA